MQSTAHCCAYGCSVYVLLKVGDTDDSDPGLHVIYFLYYLREVGSNSKN